MTKVSEIVAHAINMITSVPTQIIYRFLWQDKNLHYSNYYYICNYGDTIHSIGIFIGINYTVIP